MIISKYYKKILKKDSKFDLINFAVPIIDLIAPIGYSPNQKYDNEYFFICLINFISNNTSWTKYEGTIDHPIKGKYLNQIHNKYVKLNVYEEINQALVKKYLTFGKEQKLKCQCIDSSFIANKRGSIKNNNHHLSDKEKKENKIIRKNNKTLSKKKQKKEKTFIDTNRYNGRKKYFKVSTITDSFGTPLTTEIVSSKESDNLGLIKTVEKISVNLNTLRNSKINRYKQNFLADSGYCSKKNISFLKKKGYQPIIKYNKRNTKNKTLIEQNKFNKKQKKIYKNRFVIESFFSWIKNYPIINQNYQKTISSYKGLFSLASSIIISKRI